MRCAVTRDEHCVEFLPSAANVLAHGHLGAINVASPHALEDPPVLGERPAHPAMRRTDDQ